MKASPPPPPAAATPAPAPASPTAPPADAGPGWFPVADVVTAVLVLVAAFLAASFAARNSDVWLHLASGRLVATGAYPLGGDPFTFAGETRPWVNRSWLFDAGLYAMFSADKSGAAAVGLKSAAFTAAFGLLFLLRKPGQSAWPWAALVGVGVLASVPHSTLRPGVASLLFLSLTLLALLRGSWGPGWGLPLLLAGLFAVWANVDAWCLLGPLAVLAVLVGEMSQKRDAAAVSPVPALTRAALLGVVACLLNPTFLAAAAKNPAEAVAQLLPAEVPVGYPADLAGDPELSQLTLSPLSQQYMSGDAHGLSLNGGAFWVLFVGGGVLLGALFGRAPTSHVALWFAFAGVALMQYRLIPYFAVVAVPVAASLLAGLGGRPTGTADTPTGNIVRTFSGVGRLLTVTAAVLMALAAWPGWLQYVPAEPSAANRTEWAITANPGLERAVGVVRGWRETDALPAGVRGLNNSPEYGNLSAWFAPGERVFVTSRYRFHRADLADLTSVRRATGRALKPSEVGDVLPAVGEACDKHSAQFVVLAATRQTDLLPVFALLESGGWGLWHLDGRAAVVGKLDVPTTNRLLFNPVRVAFGPAQAPMPEANPVPPPADKPFLQRYLDRPTPVPVAADDAVVLARFTEIIVQVSGRQWQASAPLRNVARASVAGIGGAFVGPPDEMPRDGNRVALPVLVVKAARRAIAADPDRPDPYFALAEAYRTPLIPLADANDRPEQSVAALARLLARLPAPDAASIPVARTGFRAARQLAAEYARSNQLDAARLTLQRAHGYGRLLAKFAPDVFREMPDVIPPNAKVDNVGEAVVKRLDAEDEQITREVARRNDEFEQRSGPLPPAGRFELAVRLGLTRKAMELFKSTPSGEFGRDAIAVAARFVELELRAGDLAEAAVDLAELDKTSKDGASGLRDQVRALQLVLNRLAGNYKTAGEILTEAAAEELGKLSPAELKLLADRKPVLDALTRPGAGESLFAVCGTAALPAVVNQIDPAARVRTALLTEAEFYFNRGVLALYEGNIPEAKARFEQAARPQGVDVTSLGNPTRAEEVKQYLELIREAAEKK